MVARLLEEAPGADGFLPGVVSSFRIMSEYLGLASSGGC
jgi:hypothetical protein